jgi:hypothetical protein
MDSSNPEGVSPDWWSSYRAELERRFQQDEIVIRGLAVTRL